jgi:hypothetical protein
MSSVRVFALLASLFAAIIAIPAAAQAPYTVTAIAPPAAAPGSQSAVTIRIEGQIAALPSFSYDVEGATLVGVLAPTPVAANVAEGTVFLRRETPGTARLAVSFAGQLLASAEVRFGATAAIRVETTLDAGPEAAARTWRYEVIDATGAVVATLQASTSGDAPTGSVTSAPLPVGAYSVRLVLGNDTALACAPGVFYAVDQPPGAAATVDLAAGPATVRFTITPCPDLPADLEVLIPVDPAVPGSGGAAPAEPAANPPAGGPPFSEVAGVRQPGPGILPPAAGNSLGAPASALPSPLPALVVAGSLLVLTGSGALLLARRRSRPLV